MDWYQVTNSIPIKWKKKYSAKDGGFVEMPIRYGNVKRWRKDNEDGSFELVGINFHNNHYCNKCNKHFLHINKHN